MWLSLAGLTKDQEKPKVHTIYVAYYRRNKEETFECPLEKKTRTREEVIKVRYVLLKYLCYMAWILYLIWIRVMLWYWVRWSLCSYAIASNSNRSMPTWRALAKIVIGVPNKSIIYFLFLFFWSHWCFNLYYIYSCRRFSFNIYDKSWHFWKDNNLQIIKFLQALQMKSMWTLESFLPYDLF